MLEYKQTLDGRSLNEDGPSSLLMGGLSGEMRINC